MKKQGLLVAFAILAILLFTACSSETNAFLFEELSPTPPLQIHPELEDIVYMDVTDVTSTYVTVIIQNNSNWRLRTWEFFTLEAYYNGQWLDVPVMEPFGFVLIGTSIEPYGSVSFNKYLWPFTPLGAELYRIRKEVGFCAWQLYKQLDGTLIPLQPLPPDRPVTTPPPPTPTPSPPAPEGEFHPSMIDGIPTPPPQRIPFHEVVAEFDWGR